MHPEGKVKRREDGFMSGVALLTLSAACAKICGMLFKLPLFSIIGDGGMGYFNSAYVIYTFFFVLSTSGLPVGLSILIAEGTEERHRLGYFKSSVLIFGGLGGVFCLLMLFAPYRLSWLIGNPGAAKSIRVMAPSLLAVCLSGCLRGYFQGRKNMLPTALSQVIEAVFKTVLGILFAYFSVRKGQSEPHTAAMALLGVSLGSIFSFFYLAIVFFKSECLKKDAVLPEQRTRLNTFNYGKRLLAVVLPVSSASVVLSLSSLIDLSVVMRGLVEAGHTRELANELYGNYSGSVIPLFNLPSVLVAPIASAVIPFLAKEKQPRAEKAKELSSLALRLSVMISAPCALGLAFLARPILTLLFGTGSAETAAPMLILLSPAVLLVALQTVSGALLQGSGSRSIPVICLACGAVVKLVACHLLISRIGLAGAPIGTVLCYLVSAALNLHFCLRRKIFERRALLKLLLPLLCALLCGVVAFALVCILPSHGVFTLLAIGAGAGVYFGCLALCGAFDSNLRRLLPFFKGRSRLRAE